MKKLTSPLGIGTLVVLICALLAGSYFVYAMYFQHEVDSVAQNGPLESQIINQDRQLPLLAEIQYAAGITYDKDNDRFFISTDQPHTLRTIPEAYVYTLNNNLDQIEFALKLETDGDLEGITYIGDNTVVAVSETGTLIYLQANIDITLVEQKRVAIFNDSQAHKLGSLAYDAQNQHLYTAEKEGSKTIYKLDRDGTLLDSFALQVGDTIASNRAYSIETDYTIAGMTYADGTLCIHSEAYSTIFKLDVATQQLTEVLGVDKLPEVAGITVKGNQFYFVGDFENYLPTPQIHVASR